MRIHQLVHTLSYGDAISTEVLSLQRCFQMMGFASEVFAIHVHPKLKGRARNYKELEKEDFDEVILHYSLGSPLNEVYRSRSASRRSLVYHNLTPAKWFHGVNPRIAHDIEKGLEELPELLRLSDRILADSRFNSEELRSLEFESTVLELPIDPSRWDVESNTGIASVVESDPAIHLLHVGRLAPNKCIEDIVKVFYFLNRYVEKRSKLWLVGIDTDTELYAFAVKRLVHELNLEDCVNFVGCLADSELKALYQSASAYICMSEHEGYCLPVIEAMYFGLPVIAYASSALPDTVGSGGILVREKRFPEIAELVSFLCTDLDYRNKLKAAGTNRVAQLSFDIFRGRVAEVFGEGNLAQAVGDRR